MDQEELNKIKQLFATDDLSNHILGALLYINNGEGRTYRKLFWLIINDRNGWKMKEFLTAEDKRLSKDVFDQKFHIKVRNDIIGFSFCKSYRYNMFDTNNEVISEESFYKLFQDTWEDLIEKHCKY